MFLLGDGWLSEQKYVYISISRVYKSGHHITKRIELAIPQHGALKTLRTACAVSLSV